jgi:nucleotide-binding universal stress UspA family protein
VNDETAQIATLPEEAAVETNLPAAIDRILVPLDGSERAEAALPYAQAIGGPDAELILLEVVPKASDVRNIFGTVIATPERVQQGYDQVARQNLDRAAARLGDRQRVRQEVATGDPAEQILRVADEHDVGLIAMSSQGRGAWGPWALGSIVDRVVRASRRPVLVVQPGEAATDRPVAGLLVPTDGSPAAAQALPVAARLAKALGVSARVIRAIPPEGTGDAPPDVDEHELRTSRRSEAQGAVDAAVQQLRAAGVEATGEVLAGDPAATIVSAADPGDLVVLASQGEGARWELGGVADKLLRAAALPVLLVPASARGGGASTAGPRS